MHVLIPLGSSKAPGMPRLRAGRWAQQVISRPTSSLEANLEFPEQASSYIVGGEGKRGPFLSGCG